MQTQDAIPCSYRPHCSRQQAGRRAAGSPGGCWCTPPLAHASMVVLSLSSQSVLAPSGAFTNCTAIPGMSAARACYRGGPRTVQLIERLMRCYRIQNTLSSQAVWQMQTQDVIPCSCRPRCSRQQAGRREAAQSRGVLVHSPLAHASMVVLSPSSQSVLAPSRCVRKLHRNVRCQCSCNVLAGSLAGRAAR